MRGISKINIVNIGIHVFMWGILVCFPYLLMPKLFRGDHDMGVDHVLLPLIEFIVLFYLNYFILIERYVFKKKKYLLFLLFNVLAVLFFRFDGAILRLFRGGVYGQHNDSAGNGKYYNEVHFDFKNIILLFLPVIFSVAIKSVRKWSSSEAEKKDILNKNLQTELQNLKYQLQPHFFFNALNNIYSLVEISPLRAQEAIYNLSKLMRYLLYDAGREKIKLSDEIIFIKKYIELMELRQTDRTKVAYKFSVPSSETYEIAPLLFISLIENSYKHGVSAVYPSMILFELEVYDNKVTFKASNDNHPKRQGDIISSGIGVENLKKRLELIYPGRHEFSSEIVENVFHVVLKVDL